MHTFLSGNLPDMWKPFGIADFFMMMGFIWAYKKLAPEKVIQAPEDQGNVALH
jgi:hypothetical protein